MDRNDPELKGFIYNRLSSLSVYFLFLRGVRVTLATKYLEVDLNIVTIILLTRFDFYM
jgi:hypothetical protein